jgi:hypothetical protein
MESIEIFDYIYSETGKDLQCSNYEVMLTLTKIKKSDSVWDIKGITFS